MKIRTTPQTPLEAPSCAVARTARCGSGRPAVSAACAAPRGRRSSSQPTAPGLRGAADAAPRGTTRHRHGAAQVSVAARRRARGDCRCWAHCGQLNRPPPRATRRTPPQHVPGLLWHVVRGQWLHAGQLRLWRLRLVRGLLADLVSGLARGGADRHPGGFRQPRAPPVPSQHRGVSACPGLRAAHPTRRRL